MLYADIDSSFATTKFQKIKKIVKTGEKNLHNF